MKFTILIPHWTTGKMTAYSIAQLLKYEGKHEMDIVVVDNKAGDGSAQYLSPFLYDITIMDYPIDRLQSHGIAFDYVLPHIKTDFFITMESDSFPTEENWLDEYEKLATHGYDLAGSKLQLSGGEYIHPCGAMYKTDSWWEAKKFCDEIEYDYFPNMATKEGFDCHLMVHESVRDNFLEDPEEYLDLSKQYKPYIRSLAEAKREWYSPTRGPFHNGMGAREESIHSYGSRTMETDASLISLRGAKKLIRRIGYEPGQWFSYWHKMAGKKIFDIVTGTKWINDLPGRQQEYTINAYGFKHIWGVSAWKDGDPNHEFAKIKQPIPDLLYSTLPSHQKITI